ncbi:hypothetical protein EW145_g6048 [Phellinidium pouzarii]|uniref:Fungal-type protein kinase domain-containing protein n=1 Tax=Phellinidium pouzarii TaxID=167371 RepID=A0A4S4KY46_9AGAM|nr:hypothetical protein EW145_g6048 [Phellinidium pouzarii]
MMTPYGKPLESFTSLVELLQAIRSIIKTIEDLNDKDVLHRDISIRNLVLALTDLEDPESDLRGYLIDFDYAIFCKSENGKLRDLAKGRRTGTLPFMALDMMVTENDNNVPQAYYHDLESVFYVLCWICTTQEGPNSTRRSPDFNFSGSDVAKWAGYGRDAPDIELIRRAKEATVHDALNFEARVLRKFAPYFKPLHSCLNLIRAVLIFSPTGFRPGVDHKKILEDWKDCNDGPFPLEYLANIPPSQRDPKDVFEALNRIIDETLEELKKLPAPSEGTTSVPEARDTDAVESSPQEIAQTKGVNVMDQRKALREQKIVEDEKRKEPPVVRRSERLASQRDASVASTSATRVGSLAPSSTGTKNSNSRVGTKKSLAKK